MNNLLAGLLGALVATNQPPAVSNFVEGTATAAIRATETNDPVEREFRSIMEMDDAAAEEVDQWIRGNHQFAAKGAAVPAEELNRHIRNRLDPVRTAYEDFIRRHPRHAAARVAFASFLGDIGEREAEADQLRKATELDPADAAAWNNLANYYGHEGPTTNAFVCYEKAIALRPQEAVYYQNFGTTVFLFRKDAMEHFGINEQQVFDKALALYRRGLEIEPHNFLLAEDLARTYYGIKPTRTDEALNAWTNALKLARSDVEREGVEIHLARIKLNDGRFREARAHLNRVHNEIYTQLRDRVLRNVNNREAEGTNRPSDRVVAPD